MSLNIHSRSVCAVVCEVYAVRSYAYTLLVKTCVALFSLFAQMLDKKDVFFVVFGVFLQ